MLLIIILNGVYFFQTVIFTIKVYIMNDVKNVTEWHREGGRKKNYIDYRQKNLIYFYFTY